MQPAPLQTRWAKQVNPENVLPEYPRPQLARENWQNLNGLWEYAITPKDAEKPVAFSGEILVPYPVESALSGVGQMVKPDQLLWYKRSFRKPIMAAGERLLLNFGAVDWMVTVYINDKQVGEHSGGYQAFSLDVTDALKEGENELVVKVYDPTDRGPNPHGKQTLHPANIYYTPSTGIWQTVWMETVPADHITSLKITPDIDSGVVKITVNATSGLPVTLQVDGKTIQNKSNTEITIPVSNARLWSPDTPYLYDFTVAMGKDRVKSYFGMRKIAIAKDEKGIDRIFLNNRYTFNLGTLDQGFWPDGLMTAPTDEALAFDIKAIKAMGFNTIRKHIKIEPARWYYHADKTGILVWQDFVNPPHMLPEGSKAVFEKETKETMDQLHNYPSIITWVLFNEQWGAYDQQRLTEWVKRYDPSRLVNGHSGEYIYIDHQVTKEGRDNWISSDITDVHSYPDPMNAHALPGKARALGEFGGIGVAVPGHQWDDMKGWGYIQVKPDTLVEKYAAMVKQLKQLEAEGLSASIYTQPFDVEGEENGLLTYDREVIKIPVEKLRAIHAEVVRSVIPDPAFAIARNIDVKDTDDRYPELLAAWQGGKKDSAFLRRLVLMAIRMKDQPNATRAGNDYIGQLKQWNTKDNLQFIRHITMTSGGKGFELFNAHAGKINAVLGEDQSENLVRRIIGKEEIEPYLTGENAHPDWEKIEKTVTAKYGKIGEEKVYGARMVYHLEKKEWADYGKYYARYFESAVTRSEYHINNLSWYIFEHITAPAVLDVAVKTMKYDLETFDMNDANSHDTYANLLYKSGRKEEAIIWQEKAVKLSDNRKELVETLEKMKKGIPTWPDTDLKSSQLQ